MKKNTEHQDKGALPHPQRLLQVVRRPGHASLQPVLAQGHQLAGHGQAHLVQDPLVENGGGHVAQRGLLGGHPLLQEAKARVQEVHVDLETVVHRAESIQEGAPAARAAPV